MTNERQTAERLVERTEALPIGVIACQREFERGEVVTCVTADGREAPLQDHMARWFAGREPTLVSAHFASRRGDMPDLTGMATFEFPDALLANLFMSYEIPGPAATERAHYTVIGTDAVIDVHAYGAVDILRGDHRDRGYRDGRFTDANTTWDEHAPYFRRGFAAQIRDLVEAIEDDRPPTIDGHDGLAAVAMATGALRSWREGTIVRL